MKTVWAALGTVVAIHVVSARPQSERTAPFRPTATRVTDASTPAELSLRIGLVQQTGQIVTVPLEPYVARVLAGEAAPDTHPAALEALAIAIRTYALANRGRHSAEGFDLCDQTHCQVMRMSTPVTERAAAATAGRVLLDDGVPASVYYSASCGGRSEIPSEVWPGAADPSFLPSRPDDACAGAPAWSAEIADADIFRALTAGGFRGERLRDFRILSRNSSGRVARLRVEGLTPTEISGQDLRVVVGRALGWQHIKSTAFELRRVADGYRFSGHGSGHGVGLCVFGSMRLALDGKNADEILHRYFPGLTIVPVSSVRLKPDATRDLAGATRDVVGATRDAAVAARATDTNRAATDTNRAGVPGISTSREARRPPAAAGLASSTSVSDLMIAWPGSDEGERAGVASVAGRAREDLSRVLGVTAPRVTLRFHPSIASYEQATGQPWFTSGTFVHGEIHLLPPAMLRDRGVLERTIRHELVHVMIDSPLAGRPFWVREGLAQYFSDRPSSAEPPDKAPSLSARTTCPADSDLQHPVSVGALTNAYAAARSCVARQMAKGKEWRAVR